MLIVQPDCEGKVDVLYRGRGVVQVQADSVSLVGVQHMGEGVKCI